MRVLITGAGGFVGRYLGEYLVSRGDEVLGSDIHQAVTNRDFPFDMTALDITDGAACSTLIGEFKPEIIYHLAGIAFVPEAENNFQRTLDINVGGTNNVVRPCHLLKLGTTILMISSAEVYGKISDGDLPVSETCPVRPANNYSLSKLMAEQVISRYELGGYVRGLITRPFNHIGPGQNNRFVASSFAWQLSRIARGEAAPAISVGNLQAQRDFSDVRDIVSAYRLIVEKGRGIYNLSSGKAYSIQYMLDTLIRISGLDVEVKKDPERMRPSEVPIVQGDNSKAIKELGWEPKYKLEDTLEEIYNYWLEQD